MKLDYEEPAADMVCAMPVAVDRQLLNVLGVTPRQASQGDIMRAVS